MLAVCERLGASRMRREIPVRGLVGVGLGQVRLGGARLASGSVRNAARRAPERPEAVTARVCGVYANLP
jgi:hypothetical protein